MVPLQIFRGYPPTGLSTHRVLLPRSLAFTITLILIRTVVVVVVVVNINLQYKPYAGSRKEQIVNTAGSTSSISSNTASTASSISSITASTASTASTAGTANFTIVTGHIAFGACVRGWVRGSHFFVPTVTFKPLKLES